MLMLPIPTYGANLTVSRKLVPTEVRRPLSASCALPYTTVLGQLQVKVE